MKSNQKALQLASASEQQWFYFIGCLRLHCTGTLSGLVCSFPALSDPSTQIAEPDALPVYHSQRCSAHPVSAHVYRTPARDATWNTWCIGGQISGILDAPLWYALSSSNHGASGGTAAEHLAWAIHETAQAALCTNAFDTKLSVTGMQDYIICRAMLIYADYLNIIERGMTSAQAYYSSEIHSWSNSSNIVALSGRENT